MKSIVDFFQQNPWQVIVSGIVLALIALVLIGVAFVAAYVRYHRGPSSEAMAFSRYLTERKKRTEVSDAVKLSILILLLQVSSVFGGGTANPSVEDPRTTAEKIRVMITEYKWGSTLLVFYLVVFLIVMVHHFYQRRRNTPAAFGRPVSQVRDPVGE